VCVCVVLDVCVHVRVCERKCTRVCVSVCLQVCSKFVFRYYSFYSFSAFPRIALDGGFRRRWFGLPRSPPQHMFPMYSLQSAWGTDGGDVI